jgi:hypothetical protein
MKLTPLILSSSVEVIKREREGGREGDARLYL